MSTKIVVVFPFVCFSIDALGKADLESEAVIDSSPQRDH